MPRNNSRSSQPFPLVPVALGAGAIALLFLFTRKGGGSAAPTGGAFATRGTGPQDEAWFPFVNTLTPGQTFSAYKGADDVGYSVLSAPDRTRGVIRAKNLQTNQEESVALYTINRLGT